MKRGPEARASPRARIRNPDIELVDLDRSSIDRLFCNEFRWHRLPSTRTMVAVLLFNLMKGSCIRSIRERRFGKVVDGILSESLEVYVERVETIGDFQFFVS